MTRAMSLGPGRAILIHEPRRSYIAERRGRHPAGSRRRRSCGGAEGKPAGRRSASGCIGRRPRPRWELQIPAHEKPTYDPSQPMLLMRLAGRPRASPGISVTPGAQSRAAAWPSRPSNPAPPARRSPGEHPRTSDVPVILRARRGGFHRTARGEAAASEAVISQSASSAKGQQRAGQNGASCRRAG